MIETVEQLEALPVGTVIFTMMEVEGRRAPNVLQRRTLPVGNPDRPCFGGFSGLRYGPEWFAAMLPARVLYRPGESV